MKLWVVHANAPSLTVVGMHVEKVARKMGLDVRRYNEWMEMQYRIEKPDAIIWIFPVNPPMSQRYAGYYSTIKMFNKNKKMIWYGTCEGTPYGYPATFPIWYSIDFVAVSMYVANKLSELNYHVVDIIHHGYDPDEINEAEKYAEVLKKRIQHDFPGKVCFAIAEGSHKRKGWEKLSTAVKMLDDATRSKIAILAIMPNDVAKKYFDDVPDGIIYQVGEFGKMPRHYVLGLFKACDYVLVPSLIEGFGLPVLEANALGRLAIFSNHEPFNEFTDTSANITFPWDYINPIIDNGIEFEMYEYRPDYLVDAIKTAVDIAGSGEYEDRAKQAQAFVKDLTIEKQYNKLIRYILE